MCRFNKCPTYLWSPELIASSSLLRRSALGPPPLPGPTSRDLQELLTRGLVAVLLYYDGRKALVQVG